MEHSSSESHITGTASHRSSRSQTPVPPKGTVHFSPSGIPIVEDTTISDKYAEYEIGNASSSCSKACSFFRACLPTFIFTVLCVLIIMVVVFETDIEFFALLRRAPEMIAIRRQYYEPVKEQLQFVVNEIFKKSRK